MRIIEVNYNRSKGVMVYITDAERCNKKVQTRLENLRKKYKEVAIFVSGNNSMEDALANIIKSRR